MRGSSAEMLAGVGVARWKSMASHEKMLIEMIDYRRFIGGDSVSYPQCSRQMGGGALILHGRYSVQTFLELVLQEANFYLKKLVLAFLFGYSMLMQNATGCFCAGQVKSGVNQGLYLFLVLHFLNGACLFKMVRKALLKSNQASSTDRMRSISFQDTRAR